MLYHWEQFLADALTFQSLPIGMGICLLAGFLGALSPCVYPLIPITLGVLGTKQYQSRSTGFFIACIYVSGMTFFYVMFGVVSSLLGVAFGALFYSPIAILLIAFLFFIFALSLLDVVQIQLPSKMRLWSQRSVRQGWVGYWMLGAISGLLATPCTGPILGSILTLLAFRGDWFAGTMLMVAFGVGMGIPFLALGTFSSWIAYIPKGGPWMRYLKQVLGFVMLFGVAYYAHAGLLGMEMVMPFFACGWGGVLVGCGVLFVLAANRWAVYPRTMGMLGAAFGFFGLLIVVHAWQGEFKKQAWNRIHSQTPHPEQTLKRWMIQAQRDHRPVLLDFDAKWCVACRELERHTLAHPLVASRLQRFVLIQIDLTKQTPVLDRIQKAYQASSVPTLVFLDSNGKEVRHARRFGFVAPSDFLKLLDQVE